MLFSVGDVHYSGGTSAHLDERAVRFVRDAVSHGRLHLFAHHRVTGTVEEYAVTEAGQRLLNPIPLRTAPLFVEVEVLHPSDFETTLRVRGVEIGGHRILRMRSPAVPNALAALMLCLRDATGTIPHCYFVWSEASPIRAFLRFVVLGAGGTAEFTHEILREVEKRPERRPAVHVS